MPGTLLLKPWKHKKSQVSFLRSMLSIGSPELVHWNEVNKVIVNLEFNSTYKYQSLNPSVLQFWACLDLLDLLVDLSEGDEYMNIR